MPWVLVTSGVVMLEFLQVVKSLVQYTWGCCVHLVFLLAKSTWLIKYLTHKPMFQLFIIARWVCYWVLCHLHTFSSTRWGTWSFQRVQVNSNRLTTCGDGITLTTSRPTYWSDALASDKEQKGCLRQRCIYLVGYQEYDKTRFGKRLGTSFFSMSSHHIHFGIIDSKTRFSSTGRKKHWQLPGTA